MKGENRMRSTITITITIAIILEKVLMLKKYEVSNNEKNYNKILFVIIDQPKKKDNNNKNKQCIKTIIETEKTTCGECIKYNTIQ